MARESILVVDDEEDIQELVRYNLDKEGFKVHCVGDGESALKAARAKAPDLIVLDLMLPGVDGLDVCKILKGDSKTAHVPIVMLSAKGEEADIVAGLELGAEDYITKPFSPRVLVARVRVALRRSAQAVLDDTAAVKVHELVVNPQRHEVLADGKPVELTYTEFAILHFLARHPGWVFTRYQIIDRVRGQDYPVTDRSVDVQIAGLRKKLGLYGKYVETIRGVGYRFKE